MQLNYVKQKLDRKIKNLKKEKNILLVNLFKFISPKRINKIARQELKLQHIKLSQVTTFTNLKDQKENK